MARIRKVPGKILASAALIALLGASAAQLAVEEVAVDEGYVPVAYQDAVGVWTKCFGDTRNVTPGATYTFEECVASLNVGLADHVRAVLQCVPDLKKQPDKVKVAAARMGYNIGVSAFCKSSVAQYFRAGDYERGCKRIAEIYVSAKGQILPGLVTRRASESAMCLEGLREM